jgi:hypothetical protein
MWATFLIFENLAKLNNHPMGENSPNLVTLVWSNVVWSKKQKRRLI